MKIILASNNSDKLREFREILEGSGIEIIPQREAGCDFEVDETGDTFEENAYLKAEAVVKATGLPAVADDSGLEVAALGGEPGVHSARYTGSHDSSYRERCEFLLNKMAGVSDRRAQFVTSVCAIFPNGDILRTRGISRGAIGWEIRGENGFGYDAVFISEGHSCTNAELPPGEKNAISHRGRALRQLETELREYNAHNK